MFNKQMDKGILTNIDMKQAKYKFLYSAIMIILLLWCLGICLYPTVIKTIVTTEMIKTIAENYGAEVTDVLTGFKYIGEQIKLYENTHNEKRFVFGLEESYGYLRGTYCHTIDECNEMFHVQGFKSLSGDE